MKKWDQLSRKSQIILSVLFVHVTLFLGALLQNFSSKKEVKIASIRINTYQMPPKPIEKKIVAVKAKAKPTPKKIAAPKKKVAAKKKSAQKTKDPLLTEIAKSLDTLEKSDLKPKAQDLVLPKQVKREVKKLEPENVKPEYGSFLVHFLQNGLDLPEYGEVKVDLTIDRFGSVVHCEIIDTKSKKNAEFLQSALKNLTLPPLSEFGIFDPQKRFTVLFKNR